MLAPDTFHGSSQVYACGPVARWLRPGLCPAGEGPSTCRCWAGCPAAASSSWPPCSCTGTRLPCRYLLPQCIFRRTEPKGTSRCFTPALRCRMGHSSHQLPRCCSLPPTRPLGSGVRSRVWRSGWTGCPRRHTCHGHKGLGFAQDSEKAAEPLVPSPPSRGVCLDAHGRTGTLTPSPLTEASPPALRGLAGPGPAGLLTVPLPRRRA